MFIEAMDRWKSQAISHSSNMLYRNTYGSFSFLPFFVRLVYTYLFIYQISAAIFILQYIVRKLDYQKLNDSGIKGKKEEDEGRRKEEEDEEKRKLAVKE